MSFSESRYPSTRSKGSELKATQILDLKNPLASLTLGTIYLELNTYFMIKKNHIWRKKLNSRQDSPLWWQKSIFCDPSPMCNLVLMIFGKKTTITNAWFLEWLWRWWWWWLSLSLIEWVPSLSLPDRLLMSWLHQRRIKLSMNRSLTRLWVDLRFQNVSPISLVWGLSFSSCLPKILGS